ncbi:zinc-dependent alcohol dehydrogenase [Microbacterium sp. HJ5]
MRAFVIQGAGEGGVVTLPDPVALPHEVVVRVERVGLCGTDVALFNGTMPYFRQGLATYPLRPGHEWVGTIEDVGAGVTGLLPGQRVVGDTFIGCGHCGYCAVEKPQLCSNHTEVGVRGGRPGALAEKVALPSTAIYPIPDELSVEAAAFVEPGSCSMRGVELARITADSRVLVWGAGTLGLLAALFAQHVGAGVTVVARSDRSRALCRELGIRALSAERLSDQEFEAAIEATGAGDVPQLALDRLQPGGRLVLLGVPGEPATLDVATTVLKDVTVHGVLGGSSAIQETINTMTQLQHVASTLVASRVRLEEVERILQAGARATHAPGTKIQVILG